MSETDTDDEEYRPRVPKFVCPECGAKVAVAYPQGVYCVDCEVKMAKYTSK